jgi:hypothetical protein
VRKPTGLQVLEAPISSRKYAIKGSTALALGVTDMTDLQVNTTGLIMRHQNKP